MSEKDPVSRLDPSSQAVPPNAATSGSPSSLQPNLRGGGGDPATGRESPESGRVPRTNGDLTQPFPHRALGVHTILNPTESQGTYPSSGSPMAPRSVGEELPYLSTGGQYGSSPTTQRLTAVITQGGSPTAYGTVSWWNERTQERSSRWSGSFSSITRQGITLADGQPILAINPEGGERMLIPVNTNHASKAADEKRQRNAGASARFRQRKKDKEEEREMRLRRLENQSRELERQNRDLEAELERMRADRNRLRDIVSQAPGISDLAYQGPPSPRPRRSSGPFVERSPHAPAVPPAPVAGFTHAVDDPLAGERAARRRRTDSQLGCPMPAYVTTPVTLQPGHSAAAYTTSLSQPGTPSAVPPSTLPPLRLEPSSGPPPTSGPGPATGPPNFSYRREPYESGWGKHPNGPRDPGHR
ncbi:hypothetical protein DL765_003071 [Monosporascus sp. GIB2]|nr:hypothetical protein DL765_003071 [Monosporascus sp. GIB2]